MRVLLELLRIILIFAFLGGFAWMIMRNIYSGYLVAERYQWLGTIGIYILLFVFYRNKLQFVGWYKGKSINKLSKQLTLGLIGLGILLLGAPIIVSLL